MKIGMNLKIDVSKISKEKLFKGQKGTYVDLAVFIDTENADQYGNHGGITESQTKEERESGSPKNYIGNAKIFYKDQQDQPKPQQDQPPEQKNFDDDIPF